MKYISTRGDAPAKTFSEILLGGLAPDGGLYLPEHYPQVTRAELDALARAVVCRPRVRGPVASSSTTFRPPTCKAIVSKTYTAQVYCNGRADSDATQITPLRKLADGVHMLELSNGPTLAFKDMAMQLLGNLFEYELAKQRDELNILGATSGDTGSAAEYAMRGKRGIRVFMLSPHGRMSRVPAGADVFAAGPEHPQHRHRRRVRRLPGHRQGGVQRPRLQGADTRSARSTRSTGRACRRRWCTTSRATSRRRKSNDEQVAFAVPSGNFGNICAGHIARMMGLPIGQLVLATNENDVLDEFFRTGVLPRPRGTDQTYETTSPSMDISKASNFERFVFDLVGRDGAKVREFWSKVDAGGSFDIKGTSYWNDLPKFDFASGKSTHQDRLKTIREVWQEYGVMIDTHTADGLKVGLEQRRPSLPLICLETALPAKFAETIREALGREPERPAAMEGIEKLPQRCEVMDADVAKLKAFISANVPL